MKKKVLFLCTGNSCRSQMAEGWAKSVYGHSIDSFSAGTSPRGIDPLAINVMAEVGIDISQYESKHLNTLNHLQFDLVIPVCDKAARNCPIPPKRSRVVHVPFEDPPLLARYARSEEEALQHYRRVRDDIKQFITKLSSFFLCRKYGGTELM
jgi:arsenate reductase